MSGARPSALWRLPAALTVVLLCGFTCNLTGGNTSKTGQSSPSSESSAATTPSHAPPPSPEALVLGSLPFHSGEVGVAYAPITLGASGGTPPYAWSVAAGVLPPGLSLASNGALNGTSTTPGVFNFTVSVSDSASQSITGPGKITVYSALAVTQPCATGCTIGVGCAKCGGFGTPSGGQGPYAYRIVGGAVPPRMTWSALTLGGGFPGGSYSLSVLVSDAAGGTATVNASWNIYGPASLSSIPPCINSGNPPQCATRGTYSGGSPTATPKLVILGYSQYCQVTGQCYPVPSSPPMNWSVSVKGGLITISAGGLPCSPNVPYGGVLTLALADTAACATTSLSNQVQLTVFLSNNC